MRWSEIVAAGSLDNSRDGLNLMMKKTLQVQRAQHEMQASEPAVKESVSSWREILLQEKKAEFPRAVESHTYERKEEHALDSVLDIPPFESSSSNGFSSRKRLAKEIEKPKIKLDSKAESGGLSVSSPVPRNIEKRRKKNSPYEGTSASNHNTKVATPILKLRVARNWASDSEDDETELLKIGPKKLDLSNEEDMDGSKNTPPITRQDLKALTERRISKRQRQIDIGKSTVGYKNYIEQVPIDERKRGNLHHPRTPDTTEFISKRQWDVKVRSWRRALHIYDDVFQIEEKKLKSARGSRRKGQPSKNAALSAPPKVRPATLNFNSAQFPALEKQM